MWRNTSLRVSIEGSAERAPTPPRDIAATVVASRKHSYVKVIDLSKFDFLSLLMFQNNISKVI